MNSLPLILLTMMITNDIELKYDFGLEKDGFNWNIINDDVMRTVLYLVDLHL